MLLDQLVTTKRILDFRNLENLLLFLHTSHPTVQGCTALNGSMAPIVGVVTRVPTYSTGYREKFTYNIKSTSTLLYTENIRGLITQILFKLIN